ncbi:MAG: hypothetical protein A2514_11245 [Gammaproteobacteria bacterium RIFOXYD12_FULL_61_37]|nr:MAG: hypothetical protein A2514_11245 [Gammaproteobacteria bacterium RIFOXYD12_FULL_61_37]
MLNTLTEQRKEWTKSRPLSELLPWVTTLTPGLVLCKDGSIFGVLEMKGVDLEGRSGAEIDYAAASVERAIKALDDRHLVMWITARQKQRIESSANASAGRLDDLYREWKSGEVFYTMRDWMVIGLRAPDASSRMFSPVVHAIAGAVPWRDAIRAVISGGHSLSLSIDQLASQCEALESMIRQILSNLPAFRVSRVEGAELLGVLNVLASPASEPHPVRFDPDRGYLDTALGGNTLAVEADHVVFQGASASRRMAAVVIKEWPTTNAGWEETYPELMAPLLSLPAEYTLVRTLRPLSPDQSRKHVNAIRRHHLMRATSLFNHLRAAMSSGPTVVRQDPARLDDANAAGIALSEVTTGLTGWLSTALLLYADDERSLEAAVETATKRLAHNGLVTFRETLHTLSAWAGSLPGNWEESIRYVWATGANAADLSPIITLSEGEPINRHLTEQSGRTQPALAVFQTNHGTSYWLNFHRYDLGHSLVIGPSGAGKSVLMNFLLTRWQQYAPCQTYIFDKDKSCYITTLANGGQYLDPAAGNMAMNPMAGLESDADWEWFVSWLEILLTHRQHDLSAGDDKAIRDAVESVRRLQPDTRRLKSLALVLPGRLSERLAAWVEGGQYARWFDHADDSFSLDRFVTIAMDDLFRQPSVARAFLEYAFFRINRRMTGDPTIIYLEEAWFALSDPLFAARIENWLRTLRKKNGVIVMASQNLDELSRSAAFAAISDNMPTRIFLANPNVDSHAPLYMERFGLRPAQLAIIRQATAKRDYLITNSDHSRLMQARFPARILAYLRSDQRAIRSFEAWRTSGDDNYLRKYEDEMAQ